MTQEAITSYDAMGREVSSTDQNTGEVTTTTYDFMGRVVKTIRQVRQRQRAIMQTVQSHQKQAVQGLQPSIVMTAETE